MNPDTRARALEAAGVAPSDVYRDLGLSGTTVRPGFRGCQSRARGAWAAGLGFATGRLTAGRSGPYHFA